MRILLVGDHEQLHVSLQSAGMILETAKDSLEAYDYLMSLGFDALLISNPVSGAKVAQLIHDIRRDKFEAPILVRGFGWPDEAIVCLDAGADDCVSHAAPADEVVARIRALIRRSVGRASSIITTGPVTVDLTTKMVSVEGQDVHLTGKEFAMLELLSLRKGTTLTKEMILSHLYGGMDEPEIKIIDVFVCKLRAKLREAGGDGLIETVWGRGYVLRDPNCPTVGSPSLAPELKDMVTNPPWPVGRGGSFNRYDGPRVASPPLAPAAGQK